MHPKSSVSGFGSPRITRQMLLSVGACAVLSLTGCTSMQPSSSIGKVSVAVPAKWNEVVSDSKGSDASNWWHGFGIHELDDLISTALASNRDLRIATARLEQARALTDRAQADRRPQLDAVAGAQRGRNNGLDPKTERSSVGMRASWEVDLFGRGALAVDASQADAQASQHALEAAQIALAADVAAAYFELRTLAQRVELRRQASLVAENQLKVAQRKFIAGQTTALEVERWRTELAQEQATIAQLDGQRRVHHRQLAVLLGVGEAPVLGLLATGEAPPPPALKLPGELLERRPDVLRQARALDGALARVGVARKEVYPKLQIDWAGSRERTALVGGGASPQIVLAYGVSLSLPILDGGRIRSNIKIQEARAKEAMAEYEKTMLQALADAESALVQWTASEASLREWRKAEAAGNVAVSHAGRMFDAGMSDQSAVLDARRNYLHAQDEVSQAEGARWAAAVNLRRVFAGAI